MHLGLPSPSTTIASGFDGNNHGFAPCCLGGEGCRFVIAKEPVLMLELEVMLDWVCCICGNPMGATLKCEGGGLAVKSAKAFVKVPCPNCHQNNQVIFTPDEGTLDNVFPEEATARYKIPVPSYN
jgi:Zn finger protein HypA/HybF involved in hydrogenase expression